MIPHEVRVGLGAVMSQQYEQADQDEEWLYDKLDRRRVRPTEEQVDKFCDMVWELMRTRGITDKDARSMALTEVFGR